MSATSKNSELSDLASEAKDRMSADLESLKDSFSQLRKDVIYVLEGAVGVGKSSASGAVDGVKSRLSDLKDAGDSQVATLEKRIKKNPLAAAAVAFGIGVIVAKVMNLRK
jgi:ElaB/YqjD/DUF883 family membrane-anchored ribosome-binding protein